MPRYPKTEASVTETKKRPSIISGREPSRDSRITTRSKTKEKTIVSRSREHGITRINSRDQKGYVAPSIRKGKGLTHVDRSESRSPVRSPENSFAGRYKERTSRTTTRHNTAIIDRNDGHHNYRYEDRGHNNYNHRSRYSHVYRDHHNRLLHRIVQPKYSFGIFYNWGNSYMVHYDYPYYRRRYVFVSLGGYWPSDYHYRRYYWYPSHFYNWYGYYPVARQLSTTTTNYYTYNYYGDSSNDQSGYVYDTGNYATQDTYADIRENMAQTENLGPAAEELSDTYFEAGVKAFEDSNYSRAAERFAEAIRLAPEDAILPFALSQALFADGKYDQAAEVIRAIASNFEQDKEGLFYPRGLYLEEEVLLKQIDQLAGQAEISSLNPDVQLLLGYHLLGIGEIDQSIAQLSNAANTPENTAAATGLLQLAVKIKTANDEENNK